MALAHRYNRPGFDIFDYDIYSVCGDGDMMQGVSSEAESLAGQLVVDNLCWMYDDDHRGQHANYFKNMPLLMVPSCVQRSRLPWQPDPKPAVHP